MTVLGIVGNFAFGGHLPEFIDGFLSSLGDAFSASALFLLGVNMVNNKSDKKVYIFSDVSDYFQIIFFQK